MRVFLTIFIWFIVFRLSFGFSPDGIVIHTARHIKGKRFSCGEFHYAVLPSGRIIKGVDEEKEVHHMWNRSLNKRSLCVVVVIPFSFYNSLGIKGTYHLPKAQKEALFHLLFTLMRRHNIPLSQIERHLDRDNFVNCPYDGFPYFQILYDMAKIMIRSRGNVPLEDICRQKGISLPLKKAKIVVVKSQYLLKLYEGNIFLKGYEIALSNKPYGDKIKEGDRKTPLGVFYIDEKYPMRGWMEISYPDIPHARMGLKKGIITKGDYKKIVSSIRSMGVAYHYSDLGNDIGLHAGGFPYGKMRKDYTAGCIGLEDPEAYELYYAVPLGSKVIIRK